MNPLETSSDANAALSVWQRPALPLVLVIGWAVITAILSLMLFNTLEETRLRVRGTHNVLIALGDLLIAATDAETGQRGFIITQKGNYLEPFHQGLTAADAALSKLETLQARNVQQLARVADLKTLWTEKARELQSAIDIAREQGFDQARASVSNDRGKAIMDKLRKAVAEIDTVENAIRAEAITAQQADTRRLLLFTQLTTLVGFGALLYLLARARRAAEALQLEVSSRQSAQDLAKERAEQALRMRVMNRELVHRTKNLISVVQAIVRNQEKGSPEINRFVGVLSSRLVSLGATLDILVRENWHQVMLQELISGQLGHFSEEISSRITIAPGPPIKFTASEAQMLGLALHELGTNAAKYGALSVPSGRVNIGWTEQLTEEGADIELRWSEDNGPPVEKPERHGFGSRLTESLVARAVGGTAAIDYRPSGLIWTLTFRRDRPESNEDEGGYGDLKPLS
jgi:two-component sensor histidine kinase/CHASE3 domain sensor protein